jgi:XTP/dITP diphosphohydrolase
VYSARYADGQGHDSQANMNKLLKEMEEIQPFRQAGCRAELVRAVPRREMEEKNDRKAQFRTIISLIEKGEERQFEGIVKGQITREKRGESGFGYDPIFQPDGYETTFAELGSDIKNRISHRARAVAALCDYLRKNNY